LAVAQTSGRSGNQPTPEEAAAIIGILIGIGIAILVSLAISILICFLIYSAINRVPPAYRKAEPMLAFLLLIPVFNIVWNFLYLPKVSESFVAALTARGSTTVGDGGRQFAFIYSTLVAVSFCGSFIPIVNCFTGLAGLAGIVFLIMFLVKIH